MQAKIKHIVDIQIGYQFRGRIEPISGGTHQVIQIKDFDDDRKLDVSGLYKVIPDRSPKRYLVSKGDILFLSRGQKNFAFPIKLYLKSTIAASYFFILKLKTENVLPEYLAWYINQRTAQNYLHSIARRGSHMPMVPKSAFEQLKVDLPSLVIQEKIVKLDGLREKEQSLINNLKKKRGLLVQSVCLKAARHKS